MTTYMQYIRMKDLRNPDHYEANHQIVDAAADCQYITSGKIAKVFRPYQLAFAEEARIYAIALKSELTEELRKADRQCDNTISGLRMLVKSFLNSAEPAKVSAATSLEVVLSSLKVQLEGKFLTEMGQVDNLLGVLQGEQRENVALLGLTAVVEELAGVSQLMHQLLAEREDIYNDRYNGSMVKAREATDAGFSAFRNYLNAYLIVMDDEMTEEERASLAAFVKSANNTISVFNRLILKKKGSSGEDGSGSDTDVDTDVDSDVDGGSGSGSNGGSGSTGGGGEQEETTPTKYKAFFYVNGELYETLELAPGEVILAPAAPAGYEWDDFPYKMPANDITVNAVKKYVPGGGGGSGFE